MFRWPGKIPAADRPELCSSIDIVPTILAAAGLPIISPNDIGLDEIIISERTGLTFPLEDSEILAQKIIYLHQHRKERSVLSKAAQDLVSANHTLDITIQEITKIL